MGRRDYCGKYCQGVHAAYSDIGSLIKDGYLSSLRGNRFSVFANVRILNIQGVSKKLNRFKQ